MNPVVVATAPTGAYKTTTDHSQLPVTPNEVAEEAFICQQLGVSMLHLHVRDSLGNHSILWQDYEPAISAVRKRCGDDLIIQCTTESARRYDWASQFDAIQGMHHDFLSIAIREAAGNPDNPSLEKLSKVFEFLCSKDITCQIILYDLRDFELFRHVEKLFPEGRFTLLFVLGKYRKDHQSEPKDLLPFLEHNIGHIHWMVCAFGSSESDCLVEAAQHSGHVRVGFENNLLNPNGTNFENNAASVSHTINKLKQHNLSLANTDQARVVLKLD